MSIQSEERQSPELQRKWSVCPNCFIDLDEEWHFCPGCGQENLDRKVSFRTLVLDFLGDFFTFDSKFFHSLIPFLFRPGEMTRYFLDGKRAHYIPPVRILVFMCIICFTVISRITAKVDWEQNSIVQFNEDAIEEVAGIGDSISQAKIDSIVEVSDSVLNAELAEIDSIPFFPKNLKNKIKEDIRESETENLAADTTNYSELNDTLIVGSVSENGDELRLGFGEALSQLPDLAKSGMKPEIIADSLLPEGSYFRRRAIIQSAKVMQSGGEGLVSFMIGNGTISVLVAVVLLAVLLKLVYIRRKRLYVEHFIFSTHSHAALVFVTLIYALLILFLIDFNEPGSDTQINKFLLIYLGLIPYYWFSMKKVYNQGWVKTTFKLLLVGFIYLLIFFPLFMILSLGLSFFFF